MMIIIRSSYTIPDDDDNHDDEREVFIVFVYFCDCLFQEKAAPKRDKRAFANSQWPVGNCPLTLPFLSPRGLKTLILTMRDCG